MCQTHNLSGEALDCFGKERKPSCFIITNRSRHFLKVRSIPPFYIFVNVTASHFPIGHQIVAHCLHKEQREFPKSGKAFFPWAPIKTSFGKVEAFYPSFFFSPVFFFNFLPLFITNCRKKVSKAGNSQPSEGGMRGWDEKSKKAISHALETNYGII